MKNIISKLAAVLFASEKKAFHKSVLVIKKNSALKF